VGEGDIQRNEAVASYETKKSYRHDHRYGLKEWVYLHYNDLLRGVDHLRFLMNPPLRITKLVFFV
jgi:hypothetical protein